ncbi:MAG: helix-turn-helix domain-containing protein [Ruminococcus sp.]|nr:helix-turn-helix domain-containing protein [Ruminococcus sp.]
MRIKEIREENNLTQTEIAKLFCISRSTYGMWEQEKDIIPINRLNDFCNYFKISIDYVFNLTNTKSYNNYKDKINNSLSAIRLKEFRKENNLTQVKLAELLNVANGTIANYEIGSYIIATPFLYTICSKYNISSDYLLGKVDSPKHLK